MKNFNCVTSALAHQTLQDVHNRRLLFKTNQRPVAPKETITIISSFLELGRRKLSMQPKFVCGAENVVETKPANIRKWIARFFLYFRHLYSAEARVYCSQ